MEIELKTGEVLHGKILAKALTVMVVRVEDGRFLLVSKYALKNPKDFKFKEVIDE